MKLVKLKFIKKISCLLLLVMLALPFNSVFSKSETGSGNVNEDPPIFTRIYVKAASEQSAMGELVVVADFGPKSEQCGVRENRQNNLIQDTANWSLLNYSADCFALKLGTVTVQNELAVKHTSEPAVKVAVKELPRDIIRKQIKASSGSNSENLIGPVLQAENGTVIKKYSALFVNGEVLIKDILNNRSSDIFTRSMVMRC